MIPLFLAALLMAAPVDPFIEKPYLQLGNSPKLSNPERMVLMWHAAEGKASWSVEVHGSDSKAWRKMPKPAGTAVDAPGIPNHIVYRANLTGLTPGQEFEYRVLRGGKQVFAAKGRARKPGTEASRFVLFGDCSENTVSQKAIAYRTFKANPDYVVIAGDIVYTAGRISEYRRKYFPVYSEEPPDPMKGAPLLKSIPFIGAAGNHDTALSNFTRFADSLAFFYYWDQPLNGPRVNTGAPRTSHVLVGGESTQPAFRAAAGDRYPVMANFSFDYGNAHWIVLDSNAYMDWTNSDLHHWVEQDLASARAATWRFVVFHHPGFNSAKSHFTDQWMRLLSPIFEKGNVDVVFAGHVHNYQRSFPLTFTPKKQANGSWTGPKGEVDGDWKLDKEFQDGASRKPNGIIYIVSGGGGAALYNPEQMEDRSSWQAFTTRFVADAHSFSLVDLNDRAFEMKQVLDDGKTVDSFRIVK